MPDYQNLDFSINDNVAIIRLNRPEAVNGITVDMAHELLKAAATCQNHPAIRAILLTGAGKVFSAGGDLKEFAAYGEQLPVKIRELMDSLHAAIDIFSSLNAPVVIAVNGMAAGAGFSLACMGDIVMAAQSARFVMAYTAIGLSPDGGSSWFLPRLIGLRRTQELMLTNRMISAEEALEWGIVTRVVTDDDLFREALSLATSLANGPTLAYGQIKQLLKHSNHETLDKQLEREADGMSRLSGSHDGQNGIHSFLRKQQPDFNGN